MSLLSLAKKIKSLPTAPGVYIMKGKKEVLYVGKAKNLRARVRSYLTLSGDTRYAIRYLASKVCGIDFIVTSNEKEALILEDTLLKRYRPRYNIRFKDDKTYVSIKITAKEEFPRLAVTRDIKDDGSRYFGPYASSGMVRDTVKFIRRIFLLCVCTPYQFRMRKTRPCIDYEIGLCSAPAAGLISGEKYRELAEGAMMFLDGRNRELIKMLKEKMLGASSSHNYEEAAKLRDQMRSIEETLTHQAVVSRPGIDQDVFGFFTEDSTLAIDVLFIRDGRLTGKRDFSFSYSGLPIGETLGSFLNQFYRRIGAFIPDEVLTPVPLDDFAAISRWLSEKKGAKVVLKKPARGRKTKLMEMARANACEILRSAKASCEISGEISGLEDLKRRLRLTKLPRVVEAFDISNIGGKEAVGAMVTFVDASPDKSRYRLYKIRTEGKSNDYAMMFEVLFRRFKDKENLPDLILVDGGKGQLGIAADVVRGLGIKGVNLAAVAKERLLKGAGRHLKGERVYIPGVKDPVFLKEGEKGDLLLRRIRDEAHRFAVKYHRRLRKKAIGSVLEDIPGIGGKRRKMLFEIFGDLEGIKNASTGELKKIPGITQALASLIKEGLRGDSVKAEYKKNSAGG